jgi:hypothetical protein
MYDDYTPHPTARTTPTPLPTTHRGLKAIVRRARLEHLSAELLRLTNALRLPIPVEEIYLNPPQNLWSTDPNWELVYALPEEDLYQRRLEIARIVARLAGEAQWDLRIRLLGEKPFSASEVEVFALSLMLPTGLLAGINERQRVPSSVSHIFQVPLTEATVRLGELGYLSPENSHPVTDRPTS